MRDQHPYNVLYYSRNRDAERMRVARRYAERVAWLRALRDVPCADCGGRYPSWSMDFDHREPSEKCGNVTQIAGKASLDRLAAEVAKCEVVCANCHRKRTLLAPAGNARRANPSCPSARNRARAVDLLRRLREVPCTDCGGQYPALVMEFDHREPSLKKFEIMAMAGRLGLEKIRAEVAKCDIVCTNCHRDRTYRQRQARE